MIAFATLAACAGDDLSDSGYAGDYMTSSLSQQQGACDGQGSAVAVPPETAWFRLDDVMTEAGPFVGYFHCENLGECDTLYDIYKSFGQAPDGSWLTVIAASVQPPCTLSYRRHSLVRVDDIRIQITDTLQQLVDDTLSGTACNKDVAKARKDEMPCVEQDVWSAVLAN
jgi:hypothetical protein